MGALLDAEIESYPDIRRQPRNPVEEEAEFVELLNSFGVEAQYHELMLSIFIDAYTWKDAVAKLGFTSEGSARYVYRIVRRKLRQRGYKVKKT